MAEQQQLVSVENRPRVRKVLPPDVALRRGI